MKDKELATLSQKAANLAAETDKFWTYLQRDYVDQKSQSIQNVKGLLKEAFQRVTVERLNEVFRTLFVDNVRRFNIKLKSKNHENTDNFKQINQETYKKLGLQVRDVTNLGDLYQTLPKMQSDSIAQRVKEAHTNLHYKVLFEKTYDVADGQ